MHNHNNLLGKIAGVDGLKTGYTQSAGYCLSATAERNGRRIITVIMGSFGPGRQIDKGRARDLKAVELIERGFAALPAGGSGMKTAAPAPAVPPAKPGEIPTVKTEKAEQSSTPAEPMFKVPVITPQKKS
jgi:D-alanyl-D-alanine carboxypeptidase (penicillin-binding protein 5/6)